MLFFVNGLFLQHMLTTKLMLMILIFPPLLEVIINYLLYLIVFISLTPALASFNLHNLKFTAQTVNSVIKRLIHVLD